MKIAVAGATGFIGRKLIDQLIQTGAHQVIALSRSGLAHIHPHVETRACDFYSLRDAENGLLGADVGIYLLHSMSPSNRLSQGRFEDFDFILADNFARAARLQGLKQIIYVGGMIDDKPLSRHLESRLEVEHVLSSYGNKLTSLRCSIVIGQGGSSFIIVKKLVRRLPSMLLPAWVNTPCQPIYVDDLVQIILKCTGNPASFDRTFDCGAPEVLTYRKLIEFTARAYGVSRRLVDIPRIPLGLSKLWVRLVSGASKALVYPLIDSLETPMLVNPDRQLPAELAPQYTPIARAITLSLEERSQERRPLKSRPDQKVRKRREVRSVQRLHRPQGMNAEGVARAYMKWLPRFFTSILRVERSGQLVAFYITPLPKALLELEYSGQRSGQDRQLFMIRGGLLARPSARGRLEFRDGPGCEFVFAAIHDFRPRLPWWIYRFTQAPVHKFVMWAFGRFLVRLNQRRAGTARWETT